MEGRTSQTKEEILKKIDELIHIDNYPVGGNKTMQTFYEAVAERYRQAIELAKQIDVSNRMLELTNGDLVPMMEGLQEYYKYYSALASFYANMAKADEIRSKYILKLDTPQGLEPLADIARAYVEAMKVLRNADVRYSFLLSHMKQLYLQVASQILEVERDLFGVLLLKVVDEIKNYMFFHDTLAFDEMRDMDANERVQLYQLNQRLYEELIPIADLVILISQVATKYLRGKRQDYVDLAKYNREAVASNVEVMGVVAKFYSVLATAPVLKPNATKEEMRKYYEDAEKVLTDALEVLKPFVDKNKGIKKLYDAYQGVLENVRKEKQKLSIS